MPRKNKTCGVYMIASAIDGRFYIGSSVDIISRWKGHKRDLKRGGHHSAHLQRFVNKNGIESIFFCILKDLPIGTDPRKVEQVYIDALCPGFNVCKVATSCLGIKRSAECCEKNRQAQIARNLGGKRNPMYGTKGPKSPNYGKKHKPETIAKMIANHRPCSGKDNPNYGKTQSKKQTEMARATKRRRLIERTGGVFLYRNGAEVHHAASLQECALFIGVDPSSVRRAYNKGKTCKEYTIKKAR